MKTREELLALSIKELQEIAQEQYLKNRERLLDFASIAQELGYTSSSASSDKYRFIKGDIEIFVDSYSYFMTIRNNRTKQLLASTHPTERIFIEGEWSEMFEEEIRIAKEKISRREKEREDQEKRHLIDEILEVKNERE